MGKLFTKILLLFAITGVINFLLRDFIYSRVVPYYWGNTMIGQKRDYVVKKQDSINTLFIGSSKTLNQINPVLFDSLVDANGQSLHSFNFGIQAMLAPESFYVAENLLKDSMHVKLIFFELAWPKIDEYENLHNRRSYYWLDWKNFIFSTKVILASKNSMGIKTWNTLSRTINVAEKYYNFNFIEEYSKYKTEGDVSTMNTDSLDAEKGFLQLGFPPKALAKSAIKELEESRSGSLKYVNVNAPQAQIKYNSVYLKRIQLLKQECDKRGIRIVFILPSLWKEYQYKEMVPIIDQIAAGNKIIMGDVKKNPQFFELQNMYNSSHLNANGAILYTAKLAEEYLSLQANGDVSKRQ